MPLMSAEQVLVTGASGNVGRALVHQLEQSGEAVVAGARDFEDSPRKANFDFLDPATWRSALDCVDRVFLMRPPALGHPKEEIRPFIEELARRDIRRVVVLSVMGVNRAMPHWQVEQDVKAAGLSWTMLRPAFFMQNLIGPFGDEIRKHDRIIEPAGRARFSFVDAGDIAEAAAAALMDPASHIGRAYTLTGAEALGYADVASMLTAELDRTIRYEPASLRSQRRSLLSGGADPAYANVQLVINLTARLGLAKRVTGDLPDLLGHPPTTLRHFIATNRKKWAQDT